MEFTTRQYEAAHGRQPRGTGHWAFCPEGQYHRDDYLQFVFWAQGTFTDAKRAARAHFKGQHDIIVVCS
jgi:hypothetical protein